MVCSTNAEQLRMIPTLTTDGLCLYLSLSSTAADAQRETFVCYLWSCVCSPPVGAGTWQLRPRSEDRWGWGRRAVEGGTTQRCWWGLVDTGRKTSQFREEQSYREISASWMSVITPTQMTCSYNMIDLQHEGTACKIFTCSQEVNKRPLLASWDQSKVWAKNMKGWDSIWRVGAGGGVSLYVSHAYRSRCESRCASLLCVKKAEVRRATYGSRQIPGATDLSCCGMKKTWQFNVELLPCKHETWKHALVECLIHSLGLKRNVHAHISLLFVFILYSFFWFIWL